MKSKNPNSTNCDTDRQDDFSFKVGKIVGFRGLKGELKLVPSTNSLDILMEITTVKIESSKNLSSPINVVDIKQKGKVIFLLLEGYTDRNSVELLRGKEIYTQPNQLLDLDKDEWWSEDLVGLVVIDTAGNKLGKISDIYGDQGEFLEVELYESKEKVDSFRKRSSANCKP